MTMMTKENPSEIPIPTAIPLEGERGEPPPSPGFVGAGFTGAVVTPLVPGIVAVVAFLNAMAETLVLENVCD